MLLKHLGHGATKAVTAGNCYINQVFVINFIIGIIKDTDM